MRSLYNNELIGAISILSVLKELKSISCAKAMLVFPILSHPEAIAYLKRKNVNIKSMEQLILRKPECFVNFNDRFLSLFDVSMNSILVLNSLGYITIGNNHMIEYNTKHEPYFFTQSEKQIGKRALDIIKVSSKVSVLFEDEVENLYLQLRVKL